MNEHASWIANLLRLIDEAEPYWWDDSSDGDFARLAVEIGELCVVRRYELRDILEAVTSSTRPAERP